MQVLKYTEIFGIGPDLDSARTETIESIESMEAALLAHPLIQDCAVLSRESESANPEFVAYIVSTEPVASGQIQTDIQAHVQALLPPAKQPSLYIPIARLPLTEPGQVDRLALFALPAIDAPLIQRWQESLQTIPAIERVAVLPQAFRESLPALHLSDLLVNWQPKDVIQSPMLPPSVPAMGQQRLELAQLDGGEQPPAKFATLAEMLRQTAREAPENGILYLQPDGSEQFQSYPELLEASERILAGLRRLGLQPQDQVIFQFDRNSDFISAFWGCLLGGFVPVPLSVAPTYEAENTTTGKLRHTWELLKRPLILSSQNLELPIQSLFERWGVESHVTALDRLRSDEPDRVGYTGQPDDLAILLFTSGSTGQPKGVMLSHRNILSNVASSAQHNAISRADICLNWLHLDHVGSLVRCCIRDIYVGCQQIHAPAELVLEDPLRWLDWIDRYRVTHAWGPNFALGLITSRTALLQQRQWDLSSLKSLLSVAEAIVPQTAMRFWELLAPY